MRTPFDKWLEDEGAKIGCDGLASIPFEAGIIHLCKMLGESKKCSCGEIFYFMRNIKTGKTSPITYQGLNHFADCPDAHKYREPKQ
jgi:hypothetical protein